MTNLNLNLNINVSEDGLMMANIYILTGVNSEDERETLGIFSSRSAVKQQREFWTKVMEYKDTKIELHLLRLN